MCTPDYSTPTVTVADGNLLLALVLPFRRSVPKQERDPFSLPLL